MSTKRKLDDEDLNNLRNRSPTSKKNRHGDHESRNRSSSPYRRTPERENRSKKDHKSKHKYRNRSPSYDKYQSEHKKKGKNDHRDSRSHSRDEDSDPGKSRKKKNDSESDHSLDRHERRSDKRRRSRSVDDDKKRRKHDKHSLGRDKDGSDRKRNREHNSIDRRSSVEPKLSSERGQRSHSRERNTSRRHRSPGKLKQDRNSQGKNISDHESGEASDDNSPDLVKEKSISKELKDSKNKTDNRKSDKPDRENSPHERKRSPYQRKRSPDYRRRSSDRHYNDRRPYKRRRDSRDRMLNRNYRDLDNPGNLNRYWNDDKEKPAESDPEDGVVGKRYYDKKEEVRQRKTVDLLTSKTGGAYIPPAKLRMMQAEITDKSSAAYQRISWEALKKSIHGFINKVNTGNIALIIKGLLRENIVRGRGLLCKSLIQAQAASPTFTHVYAALVAVINSKFPNIGELLLKRLVLQFKRGFKRNNKVICISASTFVAHLVNQRVAHEILALEILTLLVETPTDDSVEVAISFLKESGQKLTEVTSKGVNAIFEMLRNILHEGQLDKRVQYMIEVMFQVRKDGFKDHAAVIEELDLVGEEDQFTHLITLDDVNTGEDILNVFKFDGEFEQNEGKYQALSKEILQSDSEDGSGDEEGSSDEEEEDEEESEKKAGDIIDQTETNLIVLRRTIYLTIQSSLDFEECAHKLMKMQLKPGQEMELCHMFLDCCAEQRTYEKFYGLLAQRFCQINKIYVGPFEQIFKDSYATAHRLPTNKLRNVSKFFAHLLFTDAISWDCLDCMKLNKDDTTSSSRIFIKILFQELAEYMGLTKLNDRLKDATLQESFAGLFPRDNPKSSRFAINFFTSIGLGGLTDELREHIKTVRAKESPEITIISNEKSKSNDKQIVVSSESSSSSSSDSSSSSSSSSDSSSESSDSSSSDERSKSSRKKRVSKKESESKNKKKPAETRKKNEKERNRKR